jgi:hypothetical protein
MLVRHLCDNKACVNPSHLAIGDHEANMRDVRERSSRGGFQMELAPRIFGEDGQAEFRFL